MSTDENNLSNKHRDSFSFTCESRLADRIVFYFWLPAMVLIAMVGASFGKYAFNQSSLLPIIGALVFWFPIAFLMDRNTANRIIVVDGKTLKVSIQGKTLNYNVSELKVAKKRFSNAARISCQEGHFVVPGSMSNYDLLIETIENQ